MDAETIREYRKLRTRGYIASHALREARTLTKFARLGAICYANETRVNATVHTAYQDYGNAYPVVRLVAVPDDDPSAVLDWECGCDDPRNRVQNTGPCQCRRDAYKREYDRVECRYGQPCRHKCDEARRIEREGLYGIVAEYRDPDLGWTVVDSIYGIVGDDVRDADGYGVDLMDAAITALATRPAC